MRRGGSPVAVVVAAFFLALLALSNVAWAGIVGNWDKGSRSWNNSHMTKIKSAMIAAGHQVRADGPLTEATLRPLSVFVIGEPTSILTAPEMAVLKKFLAAGGMVFLFGDTGIDLATYNNLLIGAGSTITFTATTIGTSSALPENKFTRGPTNIVGTTLSVTSGNGTAGGTLIDNNYVRYEQIGAGYMVVFGDRIDHDDVISAANTTLMSNFVSFALGPEFPIPALSPAALASVSLVLMLGGFVCIRRRERIAAR